MIYLIKIILILLISNQIIAAESDKNQILFKINNKVFTNVDFENRSDYIAHLNNFKSSELSRSEIKEILDDYISSLIFYEYYIQNEIIYKNFNNEINLLYEKNFIEEKKINEEDIQNFKFNLTIDLIRKKIIEEKLNNKKNDLLKEVNRIDLLYNYNLQNIILKEDLIDKEIIKNIDNKKKFNDFMNYLKNNEIDFFYKEEEINDINIISNKIKEIIDQDIYVDINQKNGYFNLILIDKNLESYQGIFVKLINFKTSKPFKKNELKCENINETIDINKTVFKEYEYSKLNNNIKNNLKSINDYIMFKDNDDYNYIILCDLTYDEKILKNINFNKKVNFLVKKIQNNFLKKYKNDFKFIKIK